MKRPVALNPRQGALLSRVRQKGTKPELAVAEALRELGIKYRKNVKDLPGSPDFANKTRRWAVFVNGCFWHHHRRCCRATTPTNNQEFWLEKFAHNRKRDADAIRALRWRGYHVIVIWECEAAEACEQLSNIPRSPGKAR